MHKANAQMLERVVLVNTRPVDGNYTFPSKSSSYVFSGCHVIAICGGNTSVTRSVVDNELGFVAEPDMDAVVSLFHKLEREVIPALNVDAELFEKLTPQAHATSLEQILKL